MAQAARLPLPYPEAAVVEEESLGEQTLAVASELPPRPVVLGGCCCSHLGAVEGLSARHGRIALIWLDAHGDLNTPESSPSGNEWGMPLRMLLDAGAVAPTDVALVGARNLDPPEVEFIAESGIHVGEGAVERALDGARCLYVALDTDSLDGDEVASFMPEPGGLSLAEVERLFDHLARDATVLGAGVTGALPEERNVVPVERLLTALGI
jgi:arginase